MGKLWLMPLLGLLWSTTAQATPAENLHRLLAKIVTLQGSFEQMVLDNGGTRLQQSSGSLVVRRPGMFRWQTEEPFPQLLVADGKHLWLYDQDLEQVTQQALDSRLEQTPALLLSGDLDQLSQAFEVAGPSAGDEGVYRLRPQDGNALFTQLRIAFVAGLPTEIQLEDNLGQRTSVTLTVLALNPEVPDETFLFEVPPGVDLIVE